MTTFVDQRLNTNETKFWDPLPNLKIKTFSKLSKRTKVKAADEKMAKISADRNLFGRLVIASKIRDVQEIGQEKLKEGEELVIGGCFINQNQNQAVSVTNGVAICIKALQSDHEETDTRLLLHAKHASQDHKRIVVQSPDTDLAVLCASFLSDLNCQELWFRSGVKDKLRYIPMHKVAEKLGRCLCAALPTFHALTGSDSTSSLSGIGKKKTESFPRELPLIDTTMINRESFICQLYSTDETAGTKADDMKYWLFC
ncbi:hypothetical protein HOLleu_02705 [Holothuria leucospilota]|uniref:Uncharacterized protein n=1 Tax=Holothuria leucospilota TaxID=206669 RepID=A0A9Q1HJX1_HOLLE|nr:hypothetical protein HOLleu_02705 [Holothuria leucospilota]